MSDYTQKTKFNLTYLAQEEIHDLLHSLLLYNLLRLQ